MPEFATMADWSLLLHEAGCFDDISTVRKIRSMRSKSWAGVSPHHKHGGTVSAA
jgi:hypothetical protein